MACSLDYEDVGFLGLKCSCTGRMVNKPRLCTHLSLVVTLSLVLSSEWFLGCYIIPCCHGRVHSTYKHFHRKVIFFFVGSDT